LEHPKNRVQGLQSAIVTGPEGEEIYTDQYGRVKVQFHWDRLGQYDDKTTCWVRVADTWAGANFGSIRIPRIGQEVMVEFMEGDPDRPVITGRVYNASLKPPWELPSQKSLSGIQSREIRGGQRNQLVLDDTQGQVQAQLSSDHGLSQLNLGYITRVNHHTGRDDFRGEGFELRTDKWGVVRAAKGLLVSTFGRAFATKHKKDVTEASGALQQALEQHEAQGKFAVQHNAQSEIADLQEIVKALQQQLDAIKGSGQAHSELSTPQITIASSSGLALSTEDTLQLRGATHTALTSGGHTSVASGASFLATALEKISLFAHKAGMKLFAAQGKMEVQAQSDAIEVIADQILKLISAKKSVEIAAAEEIKLSCAGSYLKINSAGIEHGTAKKWTVHAGDYDVLGPKTEPFVLPVFNAPNDNWMGLAVFGDNLQPLEDIPITYTATFLDGTVRQGALDANGKAMLENVPPGFASVKYEFPPPLDKERASIDELLPLYYEMEGVL
jgi:type VI secretion system secreted protein VgrG